MDERTRTKSTASNNDPNKLLRVKRADTKTDTDDLRQERVLNLILDSRSAVELSSGEHDNVDVANRISPTSNRNANKQRSDRILDAHRTIFDFIGHVSFDRDGGVLNIQSNSATSNLKDQHSKVERLRKSCFESALAIFRLTMILINSSGIFFLTFRVLYRYYNHIDGPEADLAVNETLPLVEMIVGVKIIEALFVVWIILRVIWQCLAMLCPCCSEGDDSLPDIQRLNSSRLGEYSSDDRGVASTSSLHSFRSKVSSVGEKVDTSVKVYTLPKYKRIAAIFWKLLPRLQGFSALQIFQFAYPGLVVKTVDMFNWRQMAARLIAEKFIKVNENHISDEELADNVLRHILILQYGPNLSEYRRECEEFLHKHCEEEINNLIWILMDARSKQGTQVSSEGVDWTALDCYFRFSLVRVAENVCKFGLIIFCFVAGYVTLFTKLCIFSSLIMMERPCPYTILAYSALFLNQVINILDVDYWLMRRVSTFLFGGSDAKMSAEEAFIMRTYEAILCERVWDSDMSCFQKFAIMLTLDDDDLQELVVEEDPERKGELLLHLRRHAGAILHHYIGDTILEYFLACGSRKSSQLQAEYSQMPRVTDTPHSTRGGESDIHVGPAARLISRDGSEAREISCCS